MVFEEKNTLPGSVVEMLIGLSGEAHALHVGTTQNGLLQEFTGQMLIIIPEGATLDRLDFVRVIPKTLSNE